MMKRYQRLRDRTIAMDFSAIYHSEWDWPQGVALYGLLRAWQYLGDQTAYEYVYNWVEQRLDFRVEKLCVNCTAPMIAVSELYKATGDDKYKPLCKLYADWLFEEALRLDCGALQHTVLQDFDFPKQAWIDTTFMACLFLTTMYEITHEERYAVEALRQLRLHHRILKDKKTGLLCHGYDELQDRCPGGALWGRGNGWLTVASVEVLAKLDGFNSDAAYVKAMLLEQVEALVQYQDAETGMWRTLINDESSYVESSGTACFAYGILYGVEKGILPACYQKMAQRAAQAIYDRVDADGKLGDVSDGTGLVEELQQYRERPKGGLMPWGQGIGLTLLAWLLR